MAETGIALLHTSAVETHLLTRALFGQLGSTISSHAIGQFANAVKRLHFREDTVIYKQGESSDHIYFLIEGRVRLDTEGEDPWLMGAGSVFGILDATIERPHNRTASAVEDATALVVAVDDWLDLVEDNLELTQATIVRNARGLWQEALKLSPHGGFLPVEEAPSLATGLGEHLLEGAAAMDPFDKLLGLRIAPVFRRAGMQPLIRLARVSSARKLAAGDVLFERGDAALSMFVVIYGRVDIEREEPTIRASFGATSLVGSYAGLCLQERAFSARAAEPSMVLEIEHDDLYELMEDHFDLVRSLQTYVAIERDRIQQLNAPRDE